jgi:UDP-glucose 4-epimerase
MKNVLIIGGCGYVGSALFKYLNNLGYHVDTVDDERFGCFINPKNIRMNYWDIQEKKLAEYDSIVMLAGHSSILMAKNDHHGALLNNIVGFEGLIGKISKQKLIYASSSSVYTGSTSFAADETWNQFNVASMYDLSKYMGDGLALISKVEFYGLRFGTVCGYSPNLRVDVMINKMIKTAKESGKILVYNPDINRPILGLIDLCRAVKAIIDGNDRRGIYNLASFNTTVGKIAEQVAKSLKVPFEVCGVSPSYDFSMLTKKFENSYDFSFQETPSSIVNSILENWSDAKMGERI